MYVFTEKQGKMTKAFLTVLFKTLEFLKAC